MNFFLGCAVWAYKDWVGDLFPPKSRPADFLQLYSRRFTTVEGNTTFYSVPDAETVARWAAETPPGFEFCLKLPRDITHQGLLEPQIPAALGFLEHMQGLGDRLGPMFVQLPPSYSPAWLDDLTAFLQAWPRETAPLALEVRHLDWFKQTHAAKLTKILEDLGVGRVLLDTRAVYNGPDDPQLNSERRKPKVPLQPNVTAPFSLVRFINHPEQDVNLEYWAEWVTYVDQWLRQGTRVYFFMHCPQEARSPGHARAFQHLLEKQGVPVPALPWDSFDQPPAQLSLF